MSLERIVRPFQLGDVFDARTLPPPAQPDPALKPNVVVSLGDNNSSDYIQLQLSGIIGGKVEWNEVSRVTRKVRITNPDDASQFVDVERIEKLTMQSTKGDEIHFNLNNP